MGTPTSNSVPVVVVTGSGNDQIDAFLWDRAWGKTSGASKVELTFSFPQAGATFRNPYSGFDEPGVVAGSSNNFIPLNAGQQTAVADALDAWSNVANINFTLVADTATSVGDIRTAFTDLDRGNGIVSWAYFPNDSPVAGDIWIDSNDIPTSTTFTPRSEQFKNLLHEIGHTLGLKHPNDGGGVGVSLPVDVEGQYYPIMLQSSEFVVDGAPDRWPTTPMVLDIQAIQYIYGANTSHNAGDTTYSYTDTGEYFETIWDGGGIDTIDYSASSTGATINLNGGEGSSLGSHITFTRVDSSTHVEDRTVYIAYNANIENAIGSSASDNIIGNALRNELRGGLGHDQIFGENGHDLLFGDAGFDTLDGGGGRDTLDGGIGSDTMRGGAGNDKYYVDNAGDVVIESSSQGTDWILSSVDYTLPNHVEWLTLTNAFGSTGTGNSINNILNGAAGNDTLIGGAGNDRLRGFDGNDVLDGGVGSDRMEGGDGDDEYHVDSTGDTVTELAGEGTDLVKSTISYTLANNVENLTLLGTGNIRATGNTLNNVLTGNSGNNILSGGGGDDQMLGGEGDDRYFVRQAGDIVTEQASEGVDWVFTTLSYTLTDHVERVTLQGSGNISATGNALANSLFGNSGRNTLDGGAGVDFLRGYAGNDKYIVDDSADRVVESSRQGTDWVLSSVDFVLPNHVEWLTLTDPGGLTGTGNSLNNILNGSSGNDMLNGLAGNDRLRGFEGNDILDGGLGNDRMEGGLGDDEYFVQSTGDIVTELAGEGTDHVKSSISHTLAANVEELTLLGTGNLRGTGNALDNTINGNSGNNTLSGAAGDDQMIGGLGNDRYFVRQAGDVVTEQAGEGVDWVFTTLSYVLPANVERVTLQTTASLNATGNALNNSLFGNSGANTLDGGPGADFMRGGGGNDLYIVDDTSDRAVESLNGGTDTVESSVDFTLAANVERLTLTGTQDISGTGNDSNNLLLGNSGDNNLSGAGGRDTLNGGTGADTMRGGSGNDRYVVDEAGDVVIEASRQGTDWVLSDVDFTLPSHVEWLSLTGAGLNGNGNNLNNLINGNAGNNNLNGLAGNDRLRGFDGNDVLDGGVGSDRMEGGDGDDEYHVDSTGDTVTELAGKGTDLVKSTISYTLANNVENLTLLGTGNIRATGNTLNNVLTGNSGNNILSGGGGDDQMIGGLGNDRYFVRQAGDIVTEQAGEGVDWVFTTLSYTLTDHVERVTLQGTSNISATGNALANSLFGNSGRNTLDGGAGVDFLRGYAGNDKYIVDDSADRVVESSGQGTDWVLSSVDFVLPNHVEWLTLTDPGGLTGTGNSLNNILNGSSGNDTLNGLAGNDRLRGFEGNDILDGGLGSDRMEGGLGDDEYFVQSTGDIVTELAGEGTDHVKSSISHTLAANVEELTLLGTGNLRGTGNALDNTINGNSGNNNLLGGLGDDTLVGNEGNDNLTGGGGNDLFIFDDNSDLDRLLDFSAGAGSDDVIDFKAVTSLTSFVDVQNAATQAGADTVIDLGAGNSVTLVGVDLLDLHTDDFIFT